MVAFPKTVHSARRIVVASMACTFVVGLALDDAWAADPKKSRARMVELNMQALHAYEMKDWQTARSLLLKALAEARVAGLEDNNMTARTYLHLGAVYWTGFHDRGAAIENFSTAKLIRPDIRLTPRIETVALEVVFDLATGEIQPDAAPEPARPPATATTQNQGGRSRLERDEDSGEPALPSTISAPLMCTVSAVVPPYRSLTIRCALEASLRANVVRIHYRPRGVEVYQTLPMRRTAGGWHIVTLPGSLMGEGTLQVYFDARDGADNQVAANGRFDSPSVIAIRQRGAGAGPDDDEDPMQRIRDQAESERYEAGLRRRRAGAIWLGIGAGLGWGYVPAGNLEWEREVRVSALATKTGMFHLLPELGYMWSDDFGLALQGRIELIRQEQAVYLHPVTGEPVSLVTDLPNAPATMAPALFARAIGYSDLSSGGNLRLSYSGDIGVGFVRLPVKPDAKVEIDPDTGEPVPDYRRTIAKTDTRPIGILLLGASVGFVWHISRHFAIALDARALTGAPAWGVVLEGGLSAQLALGGKRGSEPATEDREEGVMEEEPPIEDLSPEE